MAADVMERADLSMGYKEQMSFNDEALCYAESVEVLTNECSGTPLLSLPCGVDSAPTPIPEMCSTKWKEVLVGVNQTFPHADEFRKALHKFSIAHRFEYVYVKNSKECVYAKCKVEDCLWRITARGVGKSIPFIHVTKYTKEHVHTAQDNLQVTHARTAMLTSSIIIKEVGDHTEKRPNEIKKSLATNYGVHLTYKQAYRAKQKAIEDIHGKPEQTYMLIPWICERLKESDDKTVAEWVATGSNIFERVFIAYGCCIEGFIVGAKPILYIYVSHLSGLYKGTLLSASAFDADNEMLPFAIAIVKRETLEDWTWFLQLIKRILGSLEVTIVSDRHNVIIVVV